MRQTATRPSTAKQRVKEMRRATRKDYSAEEKIRIVLQSLRGETSIASAAARHTAVKLFVSDQLVLRWTTVACGQCQPKVEIRTQVRFDDASSSHSTLLELIT